jgi:hypothetical protein
MKKVLPVLLIFGALGGFAIWEMQAATTGERHALYAKEQSRVVAHALSRLPAILASDEASYNEEVIRWLARYFQELELLRNEKGFKEYPQFSAQDGYMNKLKKQKEAGTATREQIQTRTETYDFTKTIFDSMRMGDFEPQLSASDGGVRLDLFNIRKEELDGNQTLFADFALWGLPGEMDYGPFHSSVCLGPNTSAGREKALEKFEAWKVEALEIVKSHIKEAQNNADDQTRVRREPTRPIESIQMAAFGGELKLPLDEAKFFKNLCIQDGRRTIDAENSKPYFDLFKPGRKTAGTSPQTLIPDFPPGVAIGTYQLPLVPYHTKSMTMILSFNYRTPAGSGRTYDLKFENVQFADEWKMDEGRDWLDAKREE